MREILEDYQFLGLLHIHGRLRLTKYKSSQGLRRPLGVVEEVALHVLEISFNTLDIGLLVSHIVSVELTINHKAQTESDKLISF